MLRLMAPRLAPRIREPMAIRPVRRCPHRWKINPEGKANMSPVMANRDMRSPALAADSWKASIKSGRTGGTLNWFNGAAILARRTMTRIKKGDESGLGVRIAGIRITCLVFR